MSEPRPAVLLVDDNVLVLEGLAELLSDCGYETLEAKNGLDALKLLRIRRDVLVIVLDIDMPLMDGPAFRGEQRTSPALADIPLILITARRECATLAETLGAVACFRKPFAPRELLNAIDKVRALG